MASTQFSNYRNCFIYINGLPGIGKLTIAKALQLLMPGSVVIGNHHFIDNFPIADRYNPEHGSLRADIKDYIFSQVSTARLRFAKDKTWILTEALVVNDGFVSSPEEYTSYARYACAVFVPVFLECCWATNVTRANSPERLDRMRAMVVGGNCEDRVDAILSRERKQRDQLGNENEH